MNPVTGPGSLRERSRPCRASADGVAGTRERQTEPIPLVVGVATKERAAY